MALTGFKNVCSKRVGGIASILLARAGDISDIGYDPVSDSFGSVVTVAGAKFAGYSFIEDEASFTERTLRIDGAVKVEHELAFRLPGAGDAARRPVVEMLDASEGLVAVVVTQAGDKLLAGYSHEFGAGRPLRMKRCSGSTGNRITETPGYDIVLYSEDTSLSRLFTGIAPV